MPYTLAYKDRYRRVDESRIISDTSDSVAFASIPDDISTRLIVEWNGRQFTKLLSAVKTGAELMFPEEANEIIWQLVKAIHQPIDPEFTETGCLKFLPSAPFITYFPDSPYVGNDRSSGWNKEAWYLWGEFDTIFPDWLDNWLNGIVASLTNYQPSDVLFNIESIPLNPIDAFLNGGGILPKIEIRFSGTGSINLTLLSFPLGGKAVIELDQEPNIVDILTGGIIDPAAFIVDLDRNITNYPPDEYPIIQFPIEVTTAGDHVLYIVFIPTTDDSLTPIGFGGGFRSIELCGFSEVGTVSGIEQVIWNGCELKTVSNGIETVVVTAQQIQDCLNLPAGGSGASSIVVDNRRQAYSGTNPTTTSNTFVDFAGGVASFNHVPQRSKMLVIADNFALNNSVSGNETEIRILVNGNEGLESNSQFVRGVNTREISISDRWSNLVVGQQVQIKAQWRVSAGTGTLSYQSTLNWTIIEYDDLSDLYVEDIEITPQNELRKKIGGVWITVSASLAAILSGLQAQISAATTTANNAQNTANSALTAATTANNVNASQNVNISAIQTVNTAQNSRLTALETRATNTENLTANHETRLDALEASGSSGSVWGSVKLATIQDLFLNSARYAAVNATTYGTVGSLLAWRPDRGSVFSENRAVIKSINANRSGAAVLVKIGLYIAANGNSSVWRVRINNGAYQVMNTQSGSGLNRTAWVVVPAVDYPDMIIDVVEDFIGVDISEWGIGQITYEIININPFTLETLA